METISGDKALEKNITKYIVAESRRLLLLLRVMRINTLDLM